jgi:hypothetical protein
MGDNFDYLSAAHKRLAPEESGLDGMELRNYKMLVMRVTGATLDEIGIDFGFTRERVRQILKRVTGGTDKQLLKDVKSFRRQADLSKIDAVSKVILDHPGIRLEELAEKCDVPLDEVRPLIAKGVSKLVSDFKPAKEHAKTWSNEQVLTALRMAATHYFPLGKAEYDSLIELKEIEGPSSALVWMRFGSWSKACELAGVECHAVREHYQKTWSRAELLTYVSRFLMSRDFSSSIGSYEIWKAAETVKTPSGQLLRVEFGSWQNVVQAGLLVLRKTWDKNE